MKQAGGTAAFNRQNKNGFSIDSDPRREAKLIFAIGTADVVRAEDRGKISTRAVRKDEGRHAATREKAPEQQPRR